MNPDRETSTLDPGEMLQSEFAYIAQTAFQANEDRARVTTFYLPQAQAWLPAARLGVGFFVAQMLVYWWLLLERKPK